MTVLLASLNDHEKELVVPSGVEEILITAHHTATWWIMNRTWPVVSAENIYFNFEETRGVAMSAEGGGGTTVGWQEDIWKFCDFWNFYNEGYALKVNYL